MSDLTERMARITEMARHRHMSCEDTTSSLVGIAQSLETARNPAEVQKLAAFAMSHLAVQLGNIASALNESAAAHQEMAAYTQEGYRIEMVEIERALKEKVNPVREYIGKVP